MKIARDKIAHAIVGGAICAIVALCSYVVGIPLIGACICGLLAALAAGLAKEGYDAAHPKKHTADWRDALATLIGALGVVGIIAIGRALKALLLITMTIWLTTGLTGCGDMRSPAEVKRDHDIAKGLGTAGTFFGIPQPIGESVAGLVLLGLGAIGGHKHGRRKERNRNNSPLIAKPVIAKPVKVDA